MVDDSKQYDEAEEPIEDVEVEVTEDAEVGGCPEEADSSIEADGDDAVEVPDVEAASEEQGAGEAVRESFEEIIEAVSKEGLSPRPSADADEPEELREHLERAVRVPLEVYVRVVKDERVARALSRDISVSGIFLAALTLPVAEPGDTVMVEIGLPGAQEPIWARARVARGQSQRGFPSLALSFQELAEGDLRLIEQYVAARADYVE